MPALRMLDRVSLFIGADHRNSESYCAFISGFLTVSREVIILATMKREQSSGRDNEAGRRDRNHRKFFANWSPPVLWSAGIFYLSSLPGSVIRLPSIILIDKFLHLVVYGLLNVLVMRSCRKSGMKKSVIVASMLYSILFALSDEIHQYFVPGRLSDPMDFVADVLGVLISGWVFMRFFSHARSDSIDA